MHICCWYCRFSYKFSVCTQHTCIHTQTHTQTHRAAQAAVGVQSDINSISRLSAIILSLKPVCNIFLCVHFSNWDFQHTIIERRCTQTQIHSPLMKGQLSLWALFGSRDEGTDGEGEVNATATDQGIFNRAIGCYIKGRLLLAVCWGNVRGTQSQTHKMCFRPVKTSNLSVQISCGLWLWTSGLSCVPLMTNHMPLRDLWKLLYWQVVPVHLHTLHTYTHTFTVTQLCLDVSVTISVFFSISLRISFLFYGFCSVCYHWTYSFTHFAIHLDTSSVM